MNNDHEKIVRFDIWCPKCSHWLVDEEDMPCAECMCSTVNYESTKPVKFLEKNTKK